MGKFCAGPILSRSCVCTMDSRWEGRVQEGQARWNYPVNYIILKLLIKFSDLFRPKHSGLPPSLSLVKLWTNQNSIHRTDESSTSQGTANILSFARSLKALVNFYGFVAKLSRTVSYFHCNRRLLHESIIMHMRIFRTTEYGNTLFVNRSSYLRRNPFGKDRCLL